MQWNSNTTLRSHKIRMGGMQRKQIVAYCALTAGFGLLSNAYNFYYVKVFLNFYHIQESWFQFSQVLFLVWNAINDPLFAYCADNKNFKLLKTRRSMILYSAPFFSLSFLIPWFQWSTHPVIVGLHLVIALCLWDTLFTFIGLAACCLFTEISQDIDTRITLTRASQLASLFSSCSIMVLEHASHGLQDFRAFQVTTIFIAIFSWYLMYYCGKHCHTQYDLNQMEDGNKSADEVCHQKTGQESYWQQTWQIVRDINFISFVITNFFQEFHRTFLFNFLAIICDQLISSDEISQSARSTFYGSIPFASKILVISIAPVLWHFSYKTVIRANFIWKILGGLVMYYVIGNGHPWILIGFILLDECFANGTFSLFNLPLSDIADINMQKYKRKHPISSMVFGTNALFVKPAISLSPMLAVAVLNRYGYSQIKKSTGSTTSLTENPLSPTQLEDLKGVMFSLVCWYPIVLGTIQLISWSFYRIDNKIEKNIEVTVTS
ncbi:transmembrane protein 180-like isoform X3 [Ostrea edulis]|uniref:transmembrane protein 180-like isoform X3 n=1 Tax=Ostrea edulis TaxID=37623 RepID=UPI00209495EA|nr:transmembrane protein 180-like isoform X3 [Ostrea edulis]